MQTKTWKRNLFLVLLLVVGLCVSIPVRFLYNRNKTMLLTQTQEKALDIASTVAAFLSYDIERYRPISEAEILTTGSKLEQDYQKLNAVLREIKSKSDATFIYTSKYLDYQTSIFILDGEEIGTVLFSPFGSRDAMDEHELRTLKRGETTVTDMGEDSVWGTYLSAYAPIIDQRDQHIVGLVGVDYSEDFLKEQYSNFTWVLNTTFALFTLMLTFALHILIVTIHDRSGIDDLTKLGNKRTFIKTLRMVQSEAKKRNQNFVLCLLDVDDFKIINDTYGHPVGDVVLKHFGQALVKATNTSKVCFRYGGDEFAVILTATTLLQAQAVKETIQDEIASITISELKGRVLSASIGMAEWISGITVETLIDMSDKALYSQKQMHKKKFR